MPEHIWKEHRHGVRCEQCGAVTQKAHQLWPCEGGLEGFQSVAESLPVHSEKDRRVYYQDLVYEVCRLIDVANGNLPGKGIVCGTVEEPSTQLQQAVTVLIQKALRPAPTHAEFEKLLAIVEPLNRLRANEGASVTFICDNPDFNGQPNCAIEVTDSWTDWEPRRFAAETIAECLKLAVAAIPELPTLLDCKGILKKDSQ